MCLQSRKFGRRSGQVLIMVTFALVPMFGIIGLVTDFGYMHYLKMSAQTAAEAATAAAIIDFHTRVGGSIYTCGGDVVCSPTPTACAANYPTPANPIQRGCLYAKQNGFATGGNQRVTYQSNITATPPTVSGFGGVNYWVTYKVTQTVPQLFSAVLGNTSGQVAARSTAVIIGAADCIYALNPHISGALAISGTPDLTSSCGIYVNSDNATALTSNGTGTITAPEYDIVGNTIVPLTPTPNVHVSPVSDPLATLAPPATAPYHCDYKNYSVSNWTNPTLSPGVYCGGISIKNNLYTLSPGTYILVGGGLHAQNTNSNITGTGVFIYNTFGATNNMGNLTYTYGGVDLSGSSSVTLKSGNTGTYAGILYFEDRSAPAGTDDFGGGSDAVFEGTIYALHAQLRMHGNSTINSKYMILIADTINMVGTTQLNNDYSLLPNGSPIQQVVLVE